MRPKLLFHACCAPCGGFLSTNLLFNYDLTVYYSNSNIHPEEEYIKRRDEAQNFYASQGIGFVEEDYNHSDYIEIMKELRHEPERGKRCKLCYYHRLARTAKYAQENGFEYFGSSLAVSPHKDARSINNIGKALALKYGIKFLEGDWKKNDGFLNSMKFAKERGFYRQNYCGCEFSQLQK